MVREDRDLALCGHFQLPAGLQNREKITFVMSSCCVRRVAQIAFPQLLATEMPMPQPLPQGTSSSPASGSTPNANLSALNEVLNELRNLYQHQPIGTDPKGGIGVVRRLLERWRGKGWEKLLCADPLIGLALCLPACGHVSN